MFERLLALFGIVVVIKLIINFSRFLQTKYYFASFVRQDDDNNNWRFAEQAPQVIQLFKNAGIDDIKMSNIEPDGYGGLLKFHPSVFENLAVKRQEIVNHVLRMFHEAIGIYRHRVFEALNPLYWLEVIVFLPKRVLEYVGVSPDTALANVAQVIYWIMDFFFVIFKTDLANLIRNWIGRFFP
ncbi:MAG: hypothetical protein HQ525_04915 [Anaerolineae bacterium]|nr:hypothetical protein [Anaerolineae bacterium]